VAEAAGCHIPGELSEDDTSNQALEPPGLNLRFAGGSKSRLSALGTGEPHDRLDNLDVEGRQGSQERSVIEGNHSPIAGCQSVSGVVVGGDEADYGLMESQAPVEPSK
jgi:hypothetical protein